MSIGPKLDSCLTVQEHYVSLYSHRLHLPLWTAYKLTRQVRSNSKYHASFPVKIISLFYLACGGWIDLKGWRGHATDNAFSKFTSKVGLSFIVTLSSKICMGGILLLIYLLHIGFEYVVTATVKVCLIFSYIAHDNSSLQCSYACA